MTVNKTIAHQRPILTEDRQRFRELLRRRLIECGWRDQFKMICGEVIKEENDNNMPFEVVAEKAMPRARDLIPDAVKKEMIESIKLHLLTKKDQ